MMETADARLRLDLACSGQGLLDRAMGRCGLLQRDMSSVLVIVGKIFAPKPAEMVFVQRDNVIRQLPANTADPAFRDTVLPRTPHACSDRVDATRIQKGDNSIAELSVSIKQDITIGAGKRQSLAQLLDNPVAGWMLGAIKVQNASATMCNYKEAIECSKVQRGNREEVEGGDDLTMVVQES